MPVVIIPGPIIILNFKMRSLIRSFENAGATDVSSAKSFNELSIQPKRPLERRAAHLLIKRGILMQADQEKYYLNRERAATQRKKQITIFCSVMAFLVIVIILIALLNL